MLVLVLLFELRINLHLVLSNISKQVNISSFRMSNHFAYTTIKVAITCLTYLLAS